MVFHNAISNIINQLTNFVTLSYKQWQENNV